MQGETAAVEANRGATCYQVPRDGGEEEEEREAGGQPQRGVVRNGVLPDVHAGARPSADVDHAGRYFMVSYLN